MYLKEGEEEEEEEEEGERGGREWHYHDELRIGKKGVRLVVAGGVHREVRGARGVARRGAAGRDRS